MTEELEQLRAENAELRQRVNTLVNTNDLTAPCTWERPHQGRLTYNNGVYTCACGMQYVKGVHGTKFQGKMMPLPAGGSINIVSVAAATAVLGYDLLSGRSDLVVSNVDRAITQLGLAGSAAAGDTAVDIKIGATRVATLFNTSTGFPKQDADTFKVGPFLVPAGSPISAVVTDAASTNPINLAIDV